MIDGHSISEVLLKLSKALLERDRKIARLKVKNRTLEELCDATYVAQGADAYHHACSELEKYQSLRRKAGKEMGTEGSLCDGMSWLYKRIDELEAKLDKQKGKS